MHVWAGHALIGDVVDTDQEEGMLVAAGVSAQLDGLKHAYRGLPDLLTQVSEGAVHTAAVALAAAAHPLPLGHWGQLRG
jgi:hypothetical protein